jgi:hypothetical protein
MDLWVVEVGPLCIESGLFCPVVVRRRNHGLLRRLRDGDANFPRFHQEDFGPYTMDKCMQDVAKSWVRTMSEKWSVFASITARIVPDWEQERSKFQVAT